MLITRVMPCLLIAQDRLVKTIKFKKPEYVGDPLNAIRIYNEKEVDELLVLDITATLEHRQPNTELIRSISEECFMPLTYGGGITTREQVGEILRLGVEKVVLSTAVHKNISLLGQISSEYGSQSLVVSIDVKKSFFGRYEVWTHAGTVNTKREPVDYAKMVEDKGAGEILLHSIDREGTWTGYDIELLQTVTTAVKIPVIVCGGAGNIRHLEEAVHRGNATALAIGSMAVYQSKGMGILIGFPNRQELRGCCRGLSKATE